MPFGGLMSKISELSLSDLNHELGKAKESLLYGSSQYVQNFRSDAAQVGTMIRSESTKFGDYLKPKMPKSTSLPVIQDQQSHASHKYQYRSRTIGDNFSPAISPTDLLEESVVAKFIKVVGDDNDEYGINNATRAENKPKEKRRPTVHTREDILKKLTDFGEEEHETNDSDLVKDQNDDLEICFINEKAFDDNEGLDDESDENNSDLHTPNDLVNSDINPADFSYVDPLKTPDADEAFEIEKRRIKESACQALAQCHQIARSQVMQEKQARQKCAGLNKIKALIGIDYTELNEHSLKSMNYSSLQVIVNDMADSIEQYNKELVQLLISKDELQIEQESMLMDIGDILQKH